MNCNKGMRRMNMGGYVPGAIGMQDMGQGTYGFGGQQMTGGEMDEFAQLMQIVQNAGKVPTANAPAKQKPRFDIGQFLQAAGVGAAAGATQGKAGMLTGPIMAMFLNMLTQGKGKAPTSARTPNFNPALDDGRYGG